MRGWQDLALGRRRNTEQAPSKMARRFRRAKGYLPLWLASNSAIASSSSRSISTASPGAPGKTTTGLSAIGTIVSFLFSSWGLDMNVSHMVWEAPISGFGRLPSLSRPVQNLQKLLIIRMQTSTQRYLTRPLLRDSFLQAYRYIPFNPLQVLVTPAVRTRR